MFSNSVLIDVSDKWFKYHFNSSFIIHFPFGISSRWLGFPLFLLMMWYMCHWMTFQSVLCCSELLSCNCNDWGIILSPPWGLQRVASLKRFPLHIVSSSHQNQLERVFEASAFKISFAEFISDGLTELLSTHLVTFQFH